ncbi:hypothetical protein Pan216_34960 [Planctomycetes bacterium Pan216]|uniref:Uncharacterized protein n=1 Tax=Kolteria novifilia TaxID=2527975 RepID=A0A518B6M9_9BACT|nr:hypothetical protein Pan216_34960 [Planctomycetes bacterium Pan216]
MRIDGSGARHRCYDEIRSEMEQERIPRRGGLEKQWARRSRQASSLAYWSV